MQHFEEAPEGSFGAYASIQHTGAPDAAYITWEAMVRSGFATPSSARFIVREAIDDEYIGHLRLLPTLGSANESSAIKRLANLREVCRLTSLHPYLKDFNPHVPLYIAGVWMQAHVLTVTVASVVEECAQLSFGEGVDIDGSLINYVVWCFTYAGVKSGPDFSVHEIVDRCLELGLPPRHSRVFARRVVKELADLTPWV